MVSKRTITLVCLLYFIYSFDINTLLTFGTKISEGRLLEDVIERSEQKDSDGSFEVPWVEIQPDNTDYDATTLRKQEESSYPLKFKTFLNYFNKTLNVSMRLNTLMMSVRPKLVSYTESGELIEEDDPDNCAYYQGYEASYPDTPSTMSLCTDGLQGVLMVNGSTLLLDPSRLYLPMRQRGHRIMFGPHHLRKSETNMRLHQKLDFVMTTITEGSAGRSRRQSPDHLTGTKYVEMYVVNDKAEYTWLGSSKNNNMKRMKQVANIIDSLYTVHNIRAILMGVEVWNDNDKMVISRTGSTTLHNFLIYRRDKILPRFPNDCALFVTRVDFTGPTIGLAPVNGMCSPMHSGSVNQDTSVDFSQIAGTMTHEMGHNFGMKHDTTACYCGDRTRSCIMSAYSQVPIATTFSGCSINELNTYLRGDMARCLMAVPDLRSGLYINNTRCGNNKIEHGEECDCGLPTWCKNPCCNPNTCKFVSGYQCASGGCCRNCRLQVKETVCRKAHDSCDLDEKCDGVSPDCPEDLYIRDGTECEAANQGGYCKKGRCRSHNAQCQYGWGVGARQADLSCYQFNIKGLAYGNCGVNGGMFVRCAFDDILCGLLHCIDRPETSKYPIIGFGRRRFSFRFFKNGKQVVCDTGSASLGEGEPNPFLAFDGVKCGTGKACKGASCVSVSEIMGPSCLNNCHGNGVCTNKGTCLNISLTAPQNNQSHEQRPSKSSHSVHATESRYDTTGNVMRMIALHFMLLLLWA